MHPSSPAVSPFLLVTITLIKSTEHKIYSSDNFYRWYHFSSFLVYIPLIIYIYIYQFSFFFLCVCVCAYECAHVCEGECTHPYAEARGWHSMILILLHCSIDALFHTSGCLTEPGVQLRLQHIPGIPVSLLAQCWVIRYTQQCTGFHGGFGDLNLGPYSCTLHAFSHWAICSAFWVFSYF